MGPVSLLEEVVRDLERHAATGGWDGAPRLYALVESAEIRRQDPGLARELRLAEGVDTIAALEQGELPEADSIERALAGIWWPDSVAGCALVVERVVLPPAAEQDIPDDPDEAAGWAAAHPRREDVRMIVGVLRDGTRYAALRLRRHAADDEVLAGPDLVPALADALAATLEPDEPPDESGKSGDGQPPDGR